jgi:hypothetical protein
MERLKERGSRASPIFVTSFHERRIITKTKVRHSTHSFGISAKIRQNFQQSLNQEYPRKHHLRQTKLPKFDPSFRDRSASQQTQSRFPLKPRMSPIQILNLLQTQTRQCSIHILFLPGLIILAHPKPKQNTQHKNRRRGRQIKSVPNMVVWCIEWQE